MKTGFDLIETEEYSHETNEFKIKGAVILRILIRDVKDTAYQYARSFGCEVVESSHIIDTLKYQARMFCQQENLEERFTELYDEMKADLANYEEDEESESLENDVHENENDQSESEEEENLDDENEVSNMANYILLEEALTNTREEFSLESLCRLQANVKQCVNAWDLWNPTSSFEMLLKRSIDLAAKK